MYQRILQEVENKLGKAPRTFNWLDKLTWYKQDLPEWDWKNDEIKHSVHNWEKVFKEGKLGWGYVIQANSLLFESSNINAPGEILIWQDETKNFTPQAAYEIAHSLFELKGKSFAIEVVDEKSFAEYLENERIRVYGRQIPERLTNGLKLAVSTVFFQTRHLLDRKLGNTYFPILYLENDPMAAVVVPYKFWPKPLRRIWQS